MKMYVGILIRRKWVIILTTLVTLAVVAVGTYLIPPTYSASATLRVAQAQLGPMEYADYMYAERLMNTYVQISRSRPVLEETIQRLGLSMTPKELAGRTKVEVLPDTELIRITVGDLNPLRARDIANTLAALLVEQGQSLYSGGSKSAGEILQEQLYRIESDLRQDTARLQSLMDRSPTAQEEIDALDNKIRVEAETYAVLLAQYEQTRLAEAMHACGITVVDPAIEPSGPSSPRKGLSVMLGALVGLVGGTGLAFLFEGLDTTLHTEEQVRAIAGLPILGRIPAADTGRPWGRGRTATYIDGNSPQGEAYRLLRTNILSLSCDPPLKTLLTTSAKRAEGTTIVAANLAHAMARAGRKIVVIDGDLRLPALHHVFELSNETGLTSILKHQASLEDALQDSWIPELQVLTSGPLPSNPTELLGAPEMTTLLDQLIQEFDMVLLDAPSLLGAADAVVLAPLVDGVAVVVRLGQERQEAIEAALRQLADVKVRPVGIIVNRAEQNSQYHPWEEGDRHGSGTKLPSLLWQRLRSATRKGGMERVASSIDQLGLPTPVVGVLRGAGIESVEDLLKRDEEELPAIRGFAAKSLEQVRASLKAQGFIKKG